MSSGEESETLADSNDFSVFIFSALMPSAQQPSASVQAFCAPDSVRLDAEQHEGVGFAFIISAHWQSGIV